MAINEPIKEQDVLKETAATQPEAVPETTAAPETEVPEPETSKAEASKTEGSEPEQSGTEASEAEASDQAAGSAAVSPAEKALAALSRAKKALAAQEESYLRLAAEYDNFRRRTTKEKSDAYTNAKADAALKFLPVYDNLERALQHGTEDEAFLKGVEMTMTQLMEVLESLDIKPIDAVGKPFDPNLHNAVMHIDDETLGENMVAECFQTGFIMGEKVIRFAMVKVAN